MLQPEQEFCQQNGPERGPRLFEWQMSFFRVRGYCIILRKYESHEYLPFLLFRRHIVNAIFLKYSKEGRLS